ncbi:MAG: hypothetical protein U1F43_24355 [Myxococcota bacterium]
MPRRPIASTLLALTLGLALALAPALLASPSAQARRPTPFERGQKRDPRVRAAFARDEAQLEAAFAAAGAAWPPRAIYLRTLKLESELELWAAPAPIAPPSARHHGRTPAGRPTPAAEPPRVLVRTFHICAKSGVLGPKTHAGDGQVPEGFYTIVGFGHGPDHLSLGLSYPNAYDRARARPEPPGGDIFVHGGCVTVGCLPIEDDAVEALYVVAVLARGGGQTRIPIDLFPCRFGSDACDVARRDAAPDAALSAFWRVLEDAYQGFEATRLPPAVSVSAQGYRLAATPAGPPR